ncbi:MAG: recombinase RecA [Bacilli bacterium]|nr:recombinase RecA [Bacilli bacterium]MBR0301731.1 recombinase RecA [Bacilli bacterium]
MKKEKDNSVNALDEALKLVEKAYGKGTVMKLGDRPKVDVNVIPSGSLLIDKALGVGGYPRGRIIEIFGPESSGKTTLALHAIAECQKLGGQAAFVDAEHAIDPNYARNVGVNIDDLILSQPDSGEQALSIVEMLANSDAFDMIVVDSVAALVPECELEGEMNDQTVGAQARLMSKALRKITAILNHHECTVIFINQLREKVGVMYGNPETTTGGRALKFYASVRIDIRRTEAIKNGSDVIGNSVNVKIVKNKVAPPFKNCKVDIIYGKGISQTGEILDVGVELGVLTRVGSWYEYDGNRFANGRDNGKAYLEEHPDFKKELSDKIKSLIA